MTDILELTEHEKNVLSVSLKEGTKHTETILMVHPTETVYRILKKIYSISFDTLYDKPEEERHKQSLVAVMAISLGLFTTSQEILADLVKIMDENTISGLLDLSPDKGKDFEIGIWWGDKKS